MCRHWRNPAQKLIQGNRLIRSLVGIQKLIHVAQNYPLQFRCLFLKLEANGQHSQKIPNDYSWYLIPHIQDLRELYIDLRRWLPHVDPLHDVILGAVALRTLKLTQYPSLDEIHAFSENNSLPLFFGEAPSLLQDCVAEKIGLKHLYIRRFALSTAFDASIPLELPAIRFKLSRLMLMGIIINDVEFDWLLSSQSDR